MCIEETNLFIMLTIWLKSLNYKFKLKIVNSRLEIVKLSKILDNYIKNQSNKFLQGMNQDWNYWNNKVGIYHWNSQDQHCNEIVLRFSWNKILLHIKDSL